MATRSFVKYHGLGNDFLVLLDAARTERYDETTARVLCDRHRGVGADGLLRLSASSNGAAFTMELRNADGSVAETSGNGLRCAVLAAAHAGLLDTDALGGERFAVMTAPGAVHARLCVDSPCDASAEVHLEMGTATVEPRSSSPLEGFTAARVDIGNPHLVLIGADLERVDLEVVGPELEHSEPGGINVELAAVGEEAIDLLVWERGAGRTLACGSGSCAVAAAARSAGLCGDEIVVHNPGGALRVELSGPPCSPSVVLSGPARRVAEVTCDLEALLEEAREAP